jgi:hypothetical protein
MKSTMFTIEEIMNGAETAEGRVFKACLDLARQGEPTSFKLAVNETITAAYTPRDGSQPRVVTKNLTFQMDIPVRADTHLVIRRYDHETDELGVTEPPLKLERELWIAGETCWEKSKQFHKIYKDPMTYLRMQAAQWATKALERALEEPDADIARAFDGITDGIMDIIGTIAFQSDGGGGAMVERLSGVPQLVIVPAPVFGPTTYLNLMSTEEAIPNSDWQQLLLSFQLSDGKDAEIVRDALVADYCPDYDEEYSYNWVDTALFDGNKFGSREERLDEIRLQDYENPVIKGLRALSFALKSEGLMDANAQADFEVALTGGGDFEDYRSVVQSVRDANEEGFKAFLGANGWNFAFDPLDVAEIRFLQSKPSLQISPKL